MENDWNNFSSLSPELIHTCLRQGYQIEPYGLINHMPSYINRVYEIEDTDNRRYIIKFYRPGRWSEDAIMDEHDFLFLCEDTEIPVVAPILTADGSSLCLYSDYYFALFPKKGGRLFETNNDNDFRRLGSLIGRLHSVSGELDAANRISLSPELWKEEFLDYLFSRQLVTTNEIQDLKQTVETILELCAGLFSDFPSVPCHGDCHRGNILDRSENGLLLIDFDDMCLAPEVQDLWMLLPSYAADSHREWELMLEGYRDFNSLDSRQFLLIEPLRAMRMLYFLHWSARQRDDFHFRQAYPDWGSPAFWIKEIGDFRMQLQVIRESLE